MSMQIPITMLELEEYLFANTSAERALVGAMEQVASPLVVAKARDDIRGAFRVHRFSVFTWLLGNGVTIPAELLADHVHAAVGQQQVDKPFEPAGGQG